MYCDAHVEYIHHPTDESEINPDYILRQINPKLINSVQPSLLFLAIFAEPGPKSWDKQRFIIERYHQDIAYHSWHLVRSKDDLKKKGIKVILHIEDLSPIGKDLKKIDWLYDHGVRSIGLTHNSDNQFAGGSLGKSDLTRLGEEAIALLTERGFILDCAHLNDQSLSAVANVFQLAIFISHTGLRAVHPTTRNSGDNALKVIKQTNGFVGIGLAGSFLGHDPVNRQHYLDHINHAIRIASAKRVGIGSDLGGVISYLPSGLRSVTDVPLLKEVVGSGILGKNLFDFVQKRSTLKS